MINLTFEKYQNLMRFASKLNIQSAADLLAFKKRMKAKNNQDLYLALYYAALQVVRSAPQWN